MIFRRNGDTDDGDDELADTHSDGTNEEKASATELLNTVHTEGGHANIDDVGGDRDQEGVGDTGVLEEDGSVVEDEVDTGQLLPSENPITSGLGWEAVKMSTHPCKAVPVKVRKATLLGPPLKQSNHEVSPSASSACKLARISFNSSSMTGSVGGKDRSRPNDLAAFSSRPFLMYQRGDYGKSMRMSRRQDKKTTHTSGRKIMPEARTKAHTNWMEMGIRQQVLLVRFLVALSTIAAKRRPKVMAHW